MRRNCRTAFLKESFTDMYGHGEIHLVSVFCFFLMNAYMWGNGFTEIIKLYIITRAYISCSTYSAFFE